MDVPIHVAITGMQHYFGSAFLKPGQVVHLIKEPDNPHDHEAIKAVVTPLGKIGYVANSSHTVPKGCFSAGRLYDRFDRHAAGIVRFVLKDMAIVEFRPGLHEVYIVHAGEEADSSTAGPHGF